MFGGEKYSTGATLVVSSADRSPPGKANKNRQTSILFMARRVQINFGGVINFTVPFGAVFQKAAVKLGAGEKMAARETVGCQKETFEKTTPADDFRREMRTGRFEIAGFDILRGHDCLVKPDNPATQETQFRGVVRVGSLFRKRHGILSGTSFENQVYIFIKGCFSLNRVPADKREDKQPQKNYSQH
jgi:hypothetical protein